MNFFITIIFLFSSTVIIGQDLNHSIQRNDNDFATYHDIHSDQIDNPQKIIDAFKSIVQSRSEGSDNLSFYSYRTVVNDTLSVYILTINSFLDKQAYVFVFDKSKNKVSASPIVVDLRSAFNNEVGFKSKLLKYPLIIVSQSDSEFILCVRERVHNGNVYNAVLNKHYAITKDLLLNLKFCYEEESLLEDNTIIHRLLNNQNVLKVSIEKNSFLEYLGSIYLDFNKAVISKRECKNRGFCKMLFTTSGLNEDELLRKGKVIHY